MVTIGQKVGKFFIEKELGSGAMGSVYRARYEVDKKVYALKFISTGLAGNENGARSASSAKSTSSSN